MKVLGWLEKNFVAVCLVTIFIGIVWPQPGLKIAVLLKPFLIAILFFTALRMDFTMVRGRFRRPLLLAAAVFIHMVALPVAAFLVARLAMPKYALGVLILSAMPAGMASTALAVACGGEGAMALVVTALTSLAAPLTVPILVNLAGAAPEGGVAAMMWEMADQSFVLVYTLFSPILAAFLLKKKFPALVERYQRAYGGLAIASLGMIIWLAMSVGAQAVWADPEASVGLLAFLFGWSAFFHAAGYFMMPSLTAAQRTALSVNTAYVNNALAIVFARDFFPSLPEAMLPAVLLELPMTVMLIPLKYLTAKARAAERCLTERDADAR